VMAARKDMEKLSHKRSGFTNLNDLRL